MDVREFFRKHLMKVLVAFIALQLLIFAFVQNQNHRPKAMLDNTDVVEGRSAKISPLSNDADKDEKDVLNISNITKPKNGSVNQKGNILYYSPNKGYTGKDSLSYTVTDGKKESKPAWIVIQVLKNQPPTTHEDKTVVYSGGTSAIYVLDNDEDKERDSLSISEVTKPLFGEININGKSLLYSVGNSAASSDSFYYTVSDGNNKSKNTLVKINILKKTESYYPWLPLDIGDVSKPGKISCNANSMTIQASGSDIWNNSDGFYFIYQAIQGDCEISMKVESLEGPHEWTKSGLMIRENLGAASTNVFLGMTLNNGITTQARLGNGQFSENGERKSGLKAPYWLKLGREGDTFKVAVSPDGTNWTKMEGGTFTMAEKVYVGIAVTSHDNNAVCKTVISNYKLKGKTFVP